MREAYRTYEVVCDDAWRSGKGLSKLARIDDSLVFDRERFDRVQLMCKLEIYPQPASKPGPKKARGIQFALNERTAYGHAAKAWAFSKALCKATADTQVFCGVPCLVVYTAQMNHVAIGEFVTESERLRQYYTYSVIDERDGANWDANVQRSHRHAVVDCYEAIDKELGRVARDAIKVRGHYRDVESGTRVAYVVDGSVKSGHWDTSCGNSFLNRDISIRAAVMLNPRPVLVRGMVMGDDYLAWLYFDQEVDLADIRRQLDSLERELGINPVRGLFSDVRCVSFISLTFYRTASEKYLALPKVGRMFAKLNWTVTDLKGRDPRALASGIARSFLPIYHGWAPMRAFLRHHIQVAPDGCLDVFLDWHKNSMKKALKGDAICWEENHLVKYGSWALALEPHEWPKEQGAGLVHDPLVDLLYAVDVSDPDSRPGVIA